MIGRSGDAGGQHAGKRQAAETAALVWTTLRAQARRLGWPAATGAALALAGLLSSSIVVSQLQTEREALARQTRFLTLRVAGQADSHVRRPPGLEAAHFRSGIPTAATRQQRVAALLGIAEAAGLPLLRSEFRHEIEREAGLSRYRIALPVEGTYGQVRDFIDAALQTDTAMSLDSVRLRRTDTAQPLVQAELAFTLYMRQDGGSTTEAVALPTPPTGAIRP